MHAEDVGRRTRSSEAARRPEWHHDRRGEECDADEDDPGCAAVRSRPPANGCATSRMLGCSAATDDQRVAQPVGKIDDARGRRHDTGVREEVEDVPGEQRRHADRGGAGDSRCARRRRIRVPPRRPRNTEAPGTSTPRPRRPGRPGARRTPDPRAGVHAKTNETERHHRRVEPPPGSCCCLLLRFSRTGRETRSAGCSRVGEEVRHDVAAGREVTGRGHGLTGYRTDRRTARRPRRASANHSPIEGGRLRKGP